MSHKYLIINERNKLEENLISANQLREDCLKQTQRKFSDIENWM